MPKPYDPDLKDRALRMLAEALPERGSIHAASKHVGGLLGISDGVRPSDRLGDHPLKKGVDR